MNGFSTGEEDSRGPPDQECSLVDDGERCRRPAGNASYSKRIQKTVTQRRLKLHLDNLFTPYTLVILVTNVDAPIWFQARHIYICDYHKGVIQSARTKRRRKDSEDDSNETDTDVPEVDLFQLHLNTLRRYNRFYKVTQRPLTTKNKAPLADTLMKHFKTIPVVEKEAINFFFYMVKTNSNKLDHKNGLGSDTT
uniref:Histone deacetylase complex subunit SAP30L n=1 Tax=Timema monikensis TaxID=170555 RepID=A0A7R9EG37_9NEOP|nr:unnamed protein product [Timema monikensis]